MRTTLTLLLLCTILPTAWADAVFRNGDIFELVVGGAPAEYTQEFHLQYTVDGDTVNIPVIGRIKAVGISPSQLSAAIEKKFRDEKIFTNPTVMINMPSNQRFVTIGGAVRSPGRQIWTNEMTLTQAVMSVGGPTEWAKDTVKITRGDKKEMFSRKAINKDPTKDPKIQPGDVIEIQGDL